LVFVLIRGDREINEAKLAQVLGEKAVLASKEDFEKADLIPGFVSPLGQKNIPVFVDHCLKHNVKYVVGGNQIDTHIVGVKLDDIKITRFVDVIEAKEEDKCTSCGANLKMQSAIELGHLFKLGTKYSTKMKALFTDRDGKKKSILMGCYGIGLDRTMAAVVETHNDENGIVWPSSVAPFRVYLMNIASSDLSQKITESVYQKLIKNNVEVLYDDRDKTAGFKFAEADLIGLPLRLTISRRSLEKSCVELKRRNQEKPELIKIDKVEKFYPF